MIVDPHNYNKLSAFNESKDLCLNFLEENQLLIPDILINTPQLARLKYNGFYRNGSIHVSLLKSKVPVKNPGFYWSYTGCKADMTAPGILAHEIGHAIDAQLEYNCEKVLLIRKKRFGKFLTENQSIHTIITNTKINEPNVSSYEPDSAEFLAESIRLFILNPNLLKEGRPIRYHILANCLGLKPIINNEWKDILQNAHPRLISAQEKWILAGKKSWDLFNKNYNVRFK